MYRKKVVLTILFSLLLASLGLGQDSRTPTDSKELKRTARRMRISEQQLKNLREILREATDLALRLEPPPDALPTLCSQWIMTDRSRASDAFEKILANLKDRAFRAPDVESYSRISRVAQSALLPFVQLDADRAAEIANQWPLPASPLGDAAIEAREQLQQMVQRNYLTTLASRDPEKATPLLREAGNSQLDYSSRGMLVTNLIRSGKREEGLRLMEETISDFDPKGSNPKDLQGYINFIQQISHVEPDRLQAAIAPISRIINTPGPKADSGVRVQVGEQALFLTSTENTVLNLFRGLVMRPELLFRTLNSMPELKAKLDQIGGIDAFLSPGTRISSQNISSPDGSGRFGRIQGVVGSVPTSTGLSRPMESLATVQRELRGKAGRNPEVVKQRLMKEFGKPDQINSLISMAQMTNYEDPDLSSLCLEQAKALLPQVQPLSSRASTLQQLVSIYRNLEGEVDIGLIREGFLLADQIREEMQQKADSNPVAGPRRLPYGTQADHLEAALTAEYARQDFDAAMRFIRALPDDPAKLAMYTQILQALRSR